MNVNRTVQKVAVRLALTGAVVLTLAVIVSAQVRTQQTVQQGPATAQAAVERGEVAWVAGNDVMIKMESGELRLFPNVPDSARVTVGTRQLSVHELQPGMKLERTTITSTAPKTITTVRTVTGTVWEVIPPTTVILTMDNNTNQRFTIPKDQKFMVEGKETDAFSLRKGMKISATAITQEVLTVSQQQRTVTGTMPPPPANLPVLVVEAPPTPTPAPVLSAAAVPPPAQLPKTGSLVPLVGLLGVLSCSASLAIRMLRRS